MAYWDAGDKPGLCIILVERGGVIDDGFWIQVAPSFELDPPYFKVSQQRVIRRDANDLTVAVNWRFGDTLYWRRQVLRFKGDFRGDRVACTIDSDNGGYNGLDVEFARQEEFPPYELLDHSNAKTSP